MSSPPPLTPSTGATPVPQSVTQPAPIRSDIAPTPVYDDTATRAQLEDLQLQEGVVAQLLAVLDDAGQAVSTGAPKWVDPDVFGGTRLGERMARHTVSAQARVQEALDLALQALAQHHGSLEMFRDEVRRVEASTEEQLASVRNRVDGIGR